MLVRYCDFLDDRKNFDHGGNEFSSDEIVFALYMKRKEFGCWWTLYDFCI